MKLLFTGFSNGKLCLFKLSTAAGGRPRERALTFRFRRITPLVKRYLVELKNRAQLFKASLT